jgi:hypothetical protein
MLRYELSYWERETFFKNLDLVIIGSGIVGLAAALHAKTLHPDLRITIFERGALPMGASTRNAGFACFGSMTELLDDLTRMPENEVLSLVEKRWTGLQRLRQLAGKRNMDFQMLGGYEMFTEDDDAVFQQCKDQMASFNRKIGAITGHREVYKVVDRRIPGFKFKGVQHLILNQAEGQVHTGKMMDALLQLAAAKGIRIFNGIGIKQIEDGASGVMMETDTGWHIRASRVLVAVNGFAKRLLPDLDVTPARNQVLITEPIPGLAVKGCFHYDRGYFYFRNIDGRILLGGGRHLALEAEKTDQFGANDMIRGALIHLLNSVICPGLHVEVASWWTGILGLGPVKKPIIKKVSPNVAVSVRLSGMGVAIGTLVGQEGVELFFK